MLGGKLPPGEQERRSLEGARRDITQGAAEWLAGTPDDILAAVDAATAPGGTLTLTRMQRERLLHLTRAGMPIKDSPGGVGIARLLGVTSAWLWMDQGRQQPQPITAKHATMRRGA
jgi:hypothetical protein